MPSIAQLREEYQVALTQRVRQIGAHILILGGNVYLNGCTSLTAHGDLPAACCAPFMVDPPHKPWRHAL
jgi:hypothetical protein